MSDLTDLFEGRFGSNPVEAVQAFAGKEWGNVVHFVDGLPADVKPAAQEVLHDAQQVLTLAAEWGGTVVSAYISANMGGIETAVVNLLSGALGGASPTSAAAQDTIVAVNKLLQAVIQHAVLRFQNASLPGGTAPG